MHGIEIEVVVQGLESEIGRVKTADNEIRDAANGMRCRVSMHECKHSWESDRFSRHDPQLHYQRVSENVAIRFTTWPPSMRGRRIKTLAWNADMRKSAIRMADAIESSLKPP